MTPEGGLKGQGNMSRFATLQPPSPTPSPPPPPKLFIYSEPPVTAGARSEPRACIQWATFSLPCMQWAVSRVQSALYTPGYTMRVAVWLSIVFRFAYVKKIKVEHVLLKGHSDYDWFALSSRERQNNKNQKCLFFLFFFLKWCNENISKHFYLWLSSFLQKR